MPDDDPNAWRPVAFAAALLLVACPWTVLPRTVPGTRQGSDDTKKAGETHDVEPRAAVESNT